ncbi:hypothetical protein MBRA_02007 [Methylobacterium brachiatum]|nr:hypothetical protein MBRA_02007 [Methylobacterium brachiatum]
MQADQALDHREAEAGPLVLALVAAAPGLEERRAELGQVALADADPGIGHDDVEPVRTRAQGQVDPAAPRGELHGVRDQVDQHLTAGARIGRDLDRSRHGGHQGDPGRLGLEAHQVAAGPDQRGGIEDLRRVVEIAALDPAHVEQRVDDAEQVVAGRADDPGIFPRLIGAEADRAFAGEHLGEADDRVERRAQLVRDVGQEPALDRVGALGLGAGALQLLGVAVMLGHVAGHGHDGHGRIVGAVLDPVGAHLGMDQAGAVGTAGGRLDMQAQRQGGGPPGRGDIADRLEEGRPVGDMDPLQQAVAAQPRRVAADQAARRDRGLEHPAVAVVPGHEVVDRREQQPVAGLVVAQPLAPGALVAHVLQGLGGDVADCRDREDRQGDAGRDVHHRHGAGPGTEGDDTEHAEHGQDGGGRRGAHRAGDQGLQGNRHQPDRGRGGGAAGEAGQADHQSGQPRRRDRVRHPEGAGASEQDGGQHRQQQARDRQHLNARRDPAPDEIGRQRRHHHHAGGEARHQETLMPEPHARIVSHGFVDQTREAVVEQRSQGFFNRQGSHAPR